MRARGPVAALRVAYAFAAIARDLPGAPGLVAASLRREDLSTFWTLTLWRSIGAMAGFRNQNPHRSWMGSVEPLCDESAWRRLAWESPGLPDWAEAQRLLLAEPRFTAMDGVSPDQAACRIVARRLGRVRTVEPIRSD